MTYGKDIDNESFNKGHFMFCWCNKICITSLYMNVNIKMYMVYGDSAEVQKLVWGNVKSSTPANVASALQVATTKINSVLNLQTDMSSVPERIKTIAELYAAGLIQEARTGRESTFTKQAMEVLLAVRDQQIPTQEGNWGNVRFVW